MTRAVQAVLQIHSVFMGLIHAFNGTPERGIFVEHTYQSNLNSFLRKILVLDIFRKSVSLIDRYSSDSLVVIDDTILERNGRHIEGSDWLFDLTRGKSVLGMHYVTAVMSGNAGIFSLNLDLKAKLGLSKISLMRFIERERKDWVTEAKSNRKIFVDGDWMRLKDYAALLNLRDMTTYRGDDCTYFMKGITTRMKNVGGVQVVVSRGQNPEKFFVTNMIGWKPKQIMEMYLRCWDTEVMHRENLPAGVCRHCQQGKAELAG